MYIHELDIRDNAVIHLFLNSKLRLSELKNLSIDDLNLDAGRFSIIGKSNKERTGYINEITKKALEEYLRIQLEQINNKSDLHDTNTKMAENMLESANILDFDKMIKKA